MGRGLTGRITTLIIVLLLLLALAPILVPYKSTVGYLDMRAGRSRVVTKYFGFLKVEDEVKDTYLSRLYKNYVSEELPPPEWWYSSDTTESLYIHSHGDSFLPREFFSLEPAIARTFNSDWELFADDDTWRTYITTFFAIFQLPESKSDRRKIAEFFNGYTQEVRYQLDRPLHATDLPSIEDARRELEKRLRGGSQ